MSPDHPTPAPGRRRGILLVEDHPLTRYGVNLRISAEPDLEVCGECDGSASAMAAVRKKAPDLVLLDLSFGDRNGLEVLKDLNASHPRVPVLVFSMYPESLYAERVLRAGARGYLMKSEGAEKLIEAIRKVLRGDICVSPAMLERLAARFADRPQARESDVYAQLSDRELEVFELIGGGLRTREIARKLGVSVSTVETHRAHLKVKLGVASTGQLIRAAVEWQAGRLNSPA